MAITYDLKELRLLANEICSKYSLLCFSELDDEEFRAMMLFSITWIETFYHIDPEECVEDIECVEKVLTIHGEVYGLMLKDSYAIELNKEKIFKTIEKLSKLQQLGKEKHADP
jgi:hypothetical protein|uniref:Uncharacterized protein n=1 Tax=Ignisphaera aggregans TaxID=334771 RepID=A0A7J2U3W5_9CREN